MLIALRSSLFLCSGAWAQPARELSPERAVCLLLWLLFRGRSMGRSYWWLCSGRVSVFAIDFYCADRGIRFCCSNLRGSGVGMSSWWNVLCWPCIMDRGILRKQTLLLWALGGMNDDRCTS